MKKDIINVGRIAIVTVMAIIAMGCSKSDVTNEVSESNSVNIQGSNDTEGEGDVEHVNFHGTMIPYEPQLMDDVPSWLKSMYDKEPVLFFMICRGKGVDGIVYNIYLRYQSNGFGELYDEEGNGIALGKEYDEIKKITEWKCIYIDKS